MHSPGLGKDPYEQLRSLFNGRTAEQLRDDILRWPDGYTATKFYDSLAVIGAPVVKARCNRDSDGQAEALSEALQQMHQRIADGKCKLYAVAGVAAFFKQLCDWRATSQALCVQTRTARCDTAANENIIDHHFESKDPCKEVDDRDEIEHLKKRADLSEKDRAIVDMLLAGWSIPEIAEALGKPYSTVHRWITTIKGLLAVAAA